MDHHILLYVDPDAATRLLVQKALVSERFVVLAAASPCEAQETAALARPDLAVIDVDRVRAADLVPALRRSAGLEDVRLLASTAHAWPVHLEKMLALGFDRVVLQPFDIDTLAQELASVLPRPAPIAEDVAAEPSSGQDPERSEHASVDDVPVGEPIPMAPEVAEMAPSLPPVDVPVLWQLALTPLTASLARATAAGEGALALYDDTRQSLTIVAAASSRQAGNGSSPDHGWVIGARVAVAGERWMLPAIEYREAVAVSGDSVVASRLVPSSSHTVLIVPVASRDALHGVAILVKHRAFKASTFSPDRIARGLSQAEHIAGIVELLHELSRGTGRRRRELQQARIDATRALLVDMTTLARPSRRNGASRERSVADGMESAERDCAIQLGDRLALHLGLSPDERETLRQALEVRDVGRMWVEQVLFARGTFSAGGRERLLDASAMHGVEILKALDWPAPVVELLRVHQRHWNGAAEPVDACGRDIPLAARIMAVAAAFAASVAGRPGSEEARVDETLELLRRDAGTLYDPNVVDALGRVYLPAVGPEAQDDVGDEQT